MKPTFIDLTPEQQLNFGNGCSFVPDFTFTASCQQHDFNYTRGGNLKDKLKADWDMCAHMWSDCSVWWHYIVTICYLLGLILLPFSYFAFTWSCRYLTIEEILTLDRANKIRRDII